MAAVTADTSRSERATSNKMYDTAAIVTANTVYVGALVNRVAGSTRIRSATAATGAAGCAGVVEEIINDSGSAISAATGNTGGTVKARFSYNHEILINVKTAARTYTNINKTVFVSTNNDVTDTTDAGTALVRVPVGMIVEFDTTSTAWVALRRFGHTAAT